jgi:arylsulfatase A-like enzyme
VIVNSGTVPDSKRGGAGWLSPIAWGGLIGLFLGVLEIVILWIIPSMAIAREYFFLSALLYGVGGVLAGVVLLILAAIVRRTPPSDAFSIASVFTFFAFLQMVGFLNVLYLPLAMAPISLVVTGVVFVVFVGLGWLLYRALRLLAGTGASCGRACALGGWILAISLLVFSALMSFVPTRGAEQAAGTGEASSEINVVFVVMDALRADHLSAYGYERQTSPRIDEWASSGFLFENALAQAPWTKPSTATLLTGLYPSAHGVNLLASGIPDRLPFLPELMKTAGCRTGIFTANHFTTAMFGFGRGVDHITASQRPLHREIMLGHILSVSSHQVRFLQPVLRQLTRAERVLFPGGSSGRDLGARELTEKFLGWVDQDPEARFFAYVHYMEPHASYDPPAPYDTRFLREDLRGRPKVTDFPKYNGFLPFDPGRAMSADSLETMLALYDGEILFNDEWFGNLLDGLKDRGLFDNTLVLLTSDHGDEFYEHDAWGHGHSLFQELLHVPFVLSCPRVLASGGQRVPHVVRHIDIMPTVLEICGLTPPEGIDGASAVPILAGEEPPDPPRVVMSEVTHGGHFARSLLVGSEKVIFSQQGLEKHLALYDLEADPGETENLAEVWKNRTQELLARLDEFHAISSGKAGSGHTVTIDDETREKLKALGYIQ